MASPGRVASSSRSISSSNPTDDVSAPVLNIIRRAVVLEYINDLSLWTDEELLKLYETIQNKGIFPFDPGNDEAESLRYIIPRNAILCSIVTDGAGRGTPDIFCACPLLSSHLMMPIKAGEQVWIFQEKPQSDFTTLYWLCRIPSLGHVEDVNYTHQDRSITTEPDSTPRFPNGMGATYSMGEIKDMYDLIHVSSKANISHTAESVPRFVKRPGDIAFQGSNNTLIVLGEDRGWTIDERPDVNGFSNASKTEEELDSLGNGSIDIVAGRGRYGQGADEEPIDTSNKIIINSRDKEETDKYSLNPVEGDPDFITDSSRVYVSMKSNGDKNFGLSYPNINSTPTPVVDESPYIIVKSDEVRIIARKDDINDINGSIKIIKEGIHNDELGNGQALIMLQPDGTIVIDGPKIIIGSGIEKGPGLGTQVEIGDGAIEPLVLGDTLKSLLERLIDAFTKTGAASLALSPVGPTALNPAIIAELEIIKAELITTLSKVGKTK